ncbi:MAG TPA: hypothetical protein VJR49_01480 [Chthoniobacterales bacterium]|nr:hypothetical protein [Chthoniobacterales bacterium]
MGAWQLDSASAHDGSLDGRSLGTPPGWLGLGRRSVAVTFGFGSSNTLIFAGKGIDLLDVGSDAFVDLCIEPRREQFAGPARSFAAWL